MKKRSIATFLGTGALLAGAWYLSRREPVEQVLPEVPAVETPAPETLQVQRQLREYIVRSGDNLSRIVYRELGLRGRAIYDSLPGIQMSSGLDFERDVYIVIDGRLVSGQDGFVDLIYPGERLVLE